MHTSKIRSNLSYGILVPLFLILVLLSACAKPPAQPQPDVSAMPQESTLEESAETEDTLPLLQIHFLHQRPPP